MLRLQAQGCHNIDFVTPGYVAAQILAAVNIAAEQGLRLPLVCSCAIRCWPTPFPAWKRC